MTKNTWLISMICALALAAPAVSADDGLGTYDEDLSGYGQPRPTGHGWGWQSEREPAVAVVDAKTVQALRVAHSDDGLGTYTEDLSSDGAGASVGVTLAATH